jgi:SAM-dependent methyltransferase
VVAPGEISDGDLDEDLPDAVLTEEASEDPDGAEGDVSPLAQTLAHMAATFQTKQTEEEIEISDAPLLPLPPEALALDPPPVRGSTPPPLPIGIAQVVAGIPEALAERPRRPKRAKPWFEEVFDEDYLRTLPFMTPEQTLREVDFIEACLAVPAGGEVLDVGCGYGRHAIELVQRGLSVTGVDLSLPLLIRAADESQRRALAVNFVHSDMREMAFERQFDGAYSMLTSFGYFDEESNLKVAEGVARALKPGGRFLVDVLNRDYVVADLPARVWWEGDGCVVLEEVDFNFNTSRIITHRSVVFEDGRQLEQEISVRAYSLHELGKLLRHAGFRVREVSGSIPTRGHFFGSTSRNLIVLAEKRGD